MQKYSIKSINPALKNVKVHKYQQNVSILKNKSNHYAMSCGPSAMGL